MKRAPTKNGAPGNTPRPVTPATAEAGRRLHEHTAERIAAPVLPETLAALLAVPDEVAQHRAMCHALGARFVLLTDDETKFRVRARCKVEAPKTEEPPSWGDLFKSETLDEFRKGLLPPRKFEFKFAAFPDAEIDAPRELLNEYRKSFGFPTRAVDIVLEGALTTPRKDADDDRHFHSEQWYSVEREAPRPYVRGASVHGKAELLPGFGIKVVDIDIDKDDGLFGPPKKHVRLHVLIRPRGDEEHGHYVTDTDGTRWMKLWAGMSFAGDKPDALCIREIVLNFLRHELEESILVDGVRIWDPHVGRPGGI